jgi:LysR family glycine cleavage system transcriptional activator
MMGNGVAIAQYALVEDDIRAGRLLAPFGLRGRTNSFYYLARSKARSSSRLTRAFERWVRSDAAMLDIE